MNQRLDASLVAKWPDPIDIVNDIFIPGKTEAFKTQYTAALASRNLLFVVRERALTYQEIANANPRKQE